MQAIAIRDRIDLVAGVDWSRRLFDSLIPLPDGTSYNAYLVRGSEKTALIDTVDPALADGLLEVLEARVPKLDYLISQHAEQDHSGAIPRVLARYPQVRLLVSAKARQMLVEHLHLDAGRIEVVADGQEVSLGDRTLRFVYTPWVHWPETMCTYVPEDRTLLTCDFFGSHLAANLPWAGEDPLVLDAAKRYYAEIMMPFRKTIRKNLDKIAPLAVDLIGPSHGPVFDRPAFIVKAYEDWVSDRLTREVVIPYVSMHGSTARMAMRLVDRLAAAGVKALPFDLSVTDLGKLAIALVDAGALVVGTPTVHGAAHPVVYSAAKLASELKPKLRLVSLFVSFGWGSRASEQLQELAGSLEAEVLPPVVYKGCPTEADLQAIDRLGDALIEKMRAF